MNTPGPIALERLHKEADSRKATPVRAITLSLACLLVAVAVSLTDPDAVVRYSSFVWILAILPVFLLSYYRGWKGAAAAAALGMVALVAVEVVFIEIEGGSVDWWLLATATTLLIPITIGSGLLSEMLRKQRALALEMAYWDPMTKVSNRRGLKEVVAKAISEARRNATGVGLIFIDLVDFKSVNDNYGHAAGDEVLRQLAARLEAACRHSDSVARVGGDEFVVCCSGVSSLNRAVAIARRTLEAFGHPVGIGDVEVYVRARLGVAWYPDHADSFDELLSNADPVRAGHGKPEGGEIIVYDPSVDATASERQLIEQDLRTAIDEGGVFLAYQPIMRIGGDELVGVEALARLDQPGIGVIRADGFMAMAQTAGLMRQLDWRVLELAVAEAASWERGGPGWIAVNLSYVSLGTRGFVGKLEQLLKEHGLPPRRLVLEISAGASRRKAEVARDTLAGLGDLGVRFALDNFGHDQFSLSHLRDLEADYIKLDRSVITRLGRGLQEERLVRGVLGLAQALGMIATAVGVETPQQLQWLGVHGCTLAQGHLLGRPMEPVQWAQHRASSGVENAAAAAV